MQEIKFNNICILEYKLVGHKLSRVCDAKLFRMALKEEAYILVLS